MQVEKKARRRCKRRIRPREQVRRNVRESLCFSTINKNKINTVITFVRAVSNNICTIFNKIIMDVRVVRKRHVTPASPDAITFLNKK